MSTTKVKLREKPISKGRKSLYLDFYPAILNPDTGKKTRREFLNMYVIEKPKSPLDRSHNKQTISLANSIRSKRELEIQHQTYGFKSKAKKHKDFMKFFNDVTKNKYTSEGNYASWTSTEKQLKAYRPNGATFGEVDQDFVEGFKAHLLSQTKLKQNTRVSYYRKLLAALKLAIKADLLDDNPAKNVDSLKEESTKREYLTLKELQKLAKKPFEIPVYKSAFFFSAFTGLRFSDILKLTWGELEGNKRSGFRLRIKQKKTGENISLKVPKSINQFIGKRKDEDELVFEDLVYSAWHNTKLREWVKAAKINKHITFHCARHSFATLQLTIGTDIYVVSKLLGHKELKTTQIYSKVIDPKRDEAMNKLNKIKL